MSADALALLLALLIILVLVADGLTVGLDEIASTAVARRAADISQMGLDIQLDACPSATVSGTETLLSRMVENVIDNAVCLNDPGGWVRVTPTVDGSLVAWSWRTAANSSPETTSINSLNPSGGWGRNAPAHTTGPALDSRPSPRSPRPITRTLELHARSDGRLQVVIALRSP